jgi:hypothetical protein
MVEVEQIGGVGGQTGVTAGGFREGSDRRGRPVRGGQPVLRTTFPILLVLEILAVGRDVVAGRRREGRIE